MANSAANQRSKIYILAHVVYLITKKRNWMDDLNAILTPGMLVRHPEMPQWGVGQVQSNIGGKLTVNFRDAGKVVIDSSRIALQPIFDE